MTSKVKDYINVFIILSFAWIIALGGGYESLSYNGYPILILCMITSFLVHWIIFIPSFLAKTEKKLEEFSLVLDATQISLIRSIHRYLFSFKKETSYSATFS